MMDRCEALVAALKAEHEVIKNLSTTETMLARIEAEKRAARLVDALINTQTTVKYD